MKLIWSTWLYVCCFIAISSHAEITESGEEEDIVSSFQKSVEDMQVKLKELREVNEQFRNELVILKQEKEIRQLQFENKMLEANTELIQLIKDQRNIFEDFSKNNLFLINWVTQLSKQNQENSEIITTAVDKMIKEFQLRHWQISDSKVVNYDHNKALLEISQFWRYTPIAEVLISLGADVNTTDADRQTPLMKSAYCDRTYSNVINTGYETSKLLLKHGAHVNAQDKDGTTALMRLVSSCSHDRNSDKANEFLRLLIENNANVDLTNINKATALMLAVEKNYLEFVKILIENNADVNIASSSYTPLTLAVEKEDINMVKILLKHGALVEPSNGTSRYSDTALMMACRKNNAQIAFALLEVPQNLNIQNGAGQTALMLAANVEYNRELIKKLIELGADLYIKDNNGKTVLEQQQHSYRYGFISSFITTPKPNTTT